jgi:hypothetical protein
MFKTTFKSAIHLKFSVLHSSWNLNATVSVRLKEKITLPGDKPSMLAPYSVANTCTCMFICESYKLKVKNIECQALSYIETEACQHLIVWPVSERRVHYPTASLEPNQRVSVNQLSL